MRHKQQRIGDFGRPVIHGVHRYKVYGCRCDVCLAEMSAYQKARYVPKADAIVACPTSWWTQAPVDGFTAYVEQDQLPRMRLARFGQGMTRPFNTDELSR